MMINEKSKLFKVEFPDFNMEIAHCTLKDNLNGYESILIVFVSKFTADELESNWNFINSWIAANVQLDFETEFEIWNLYLVFVVSSEIDKHLKYKIENNTFSSRKIVIDDGMSKEDVIKKYITKSDFTSYLTKDIIKRSSITVRDEANTLQKNIVSGKITSVSSINLGDSHEKIETENFLDKDRFQFIPNSVLFDLIKKYDLSGRKDEKTKEALEILIKKWEENENQNG